MAGASNVRNPPDPFPINADTETIPKYETPAIFSTSVQNSSSSSLVNLAPFDPFPCIRVSDTSLDSVYSPVVIGCEPTNPNTVYPLHKNTSEMNFSFTGTVLPVYLGKKYKKVANRVNPIKAIVPEEFRIVRRRHPDPLADIPILPTHPPDFTPGHRYTQDRKDAHNANPTGFLWPEEEKLVHYLIKIQEDAFAWKETEKGRFDAKYFDPIIIPTVDHIPWVFKNIPIPPGIYDEVLKVIREKIAAGVYEESNSSYRSQWFCVLKKDGKSLRLVHNLQPLNKVTIGDSAVPPIMEVFAESFAGRGCYGSLDLFVSFDQRSLDERSRDLTTFQTPLGAKRLTCVPMGYTNATQIMHGDVTHILQDEIPHLTIPFVDDVAIKGPETRYELPDGTYETIPENPHIRRFVWEHLNNVNRVLQRIKKVGGTFNGKKTTICTPETIVTGHTCTYEGRVPDASNVQRIRDWPPCETLTDVRSFLGVCGLLRIFIKNYAVLARPLVSLTRKDVPFRFGEEEQNSMDRLKHAIVNSSAVRPIDYRSGRPVIMAVDSSNIAVGFALSQIGQDGIRYPSRFGSITWNEREARYSQAKIELYGLFRALRSYRIYLIGLPKFTVEMDAKFIKGMLNNPDVQPNAAMNRWIAGILLFDFDLVHIPADKHTGADGLSRRRAADGEEDTDSEDHEDWIDRSYVFAMEHMNQAPDVSYPSETPLAGIAHSRFKVYTGSMLLNSMVPSNNLPAPSEPSTILIPRPDAAKKREEQIRKIESFLRNPIRPSGIDANQFRRLVRSASQFFILDDKLWRRRPNRCHQVVPPDHKRLAIITEAHDSLGHKGIYVIRTRILNRFWWPVLDQDVKWFVRTCHQCQTRQIRKIFIPPTVATPAGLFRRAHIDTMFLPRARGFRLLVHARCSLSAYPEARPLRNETARLIGTFIFEDILCRWGAVEEIITDNGSPFIKALDFLKERYGISHIRISGYNSRANGVIERAHRSVRESLMKAANGDESKWLDVLPSVIWAERTTIQRSTGHSPFYIAHGVEPLFPFDISEATYLIPTADAPMTTPELIALRARQLQKREKDLATIADKVLAARKQSVKQFIDAHRKSIIDYDFQPGSLVLIRNSAVEMELNRKTKPRFFGPMIVVRRTQYGAYILSELDGAVSKIHYAAFRIIPYYPRSQTSIPVTSIIDQTTEINEDISPNQVIEASHISTDTEDEESQAAELSDESDNEAADDFTTESHPQRSEVIRNLRPRR